MSCSSRCRNAKPSSPCACSCNGANHGRGYGSSRSRQRSRRIGSAFNRSNKPRSLGKLTLDTGIDTGIKVVAIFEPTVATAYTAYKFGRIAYDYLKNKENRALTDIRNYIISDAAERVSEDKAAYIAKRVRTAVSASGALIKTAQIIGVDPSLYEYMFEGTVKSGIESSAGNLSEYTIEILGGG